MCRVVPVVLLVGCAQIAGIEKTTGAPQDDAAVLDDAAPDAPVDAPIDSPPDARPCEGGDARVSDPSTGTCYVLFTSPMTRNAARTACLGLGAGAQLAKVGSAEVNALLTTLIGANEVFVGASDEAVEGTFVWEDGSPVVFTSWNTGEPNNGGDFIQEDCVVLIGSAGGRWDDRACAPVSIAPNIGSFPFVCMYP